MRLLQGSRLRKRKGAPLMASCIASMISAVCDSVLHSSEPAPYLQEATVSLWAVICEDPTACEVLDS